MDIRTILSGAGLLGFAVMFGLWKWSNHDLNISEVARKQQITITACEVQKTQAAADAGRQNADQLKQMQATIAGQLKVINSFKAEKRRLNASLSQALKDIANVKDNPPVSDAMQHALELVRRALAGSGGAPANPGDEGGNGAAAPSDGSAVRPSTSPTPET